MLSLLVTLLLALAPANPPSAACAAWTWSGDKFEDLKLAFDQAASGTDAQARRAALEALVAVPNPAAAPAISAVYTRVTTIVDEQSAKALRARALIDRKQVLIEQWKLRASHDESARPSLEREQKSLDEQKQELAKADRRLAEETPWRSQLADATARLLGGL